MSESNLILAILIVMALGLVWLGWRFRRAWKAFLMSLNRRRGKKGEMLAVKVLEKAGYEVLQGQTTLEGTFNVDGRAVGYQVRPDFLVSKAGQTYVAEVKTGDSAKISDRNTRRQLREYAELTEGGEEVLLVDGQRGLIFTVTFDGV